MNKSPAFQFYYKEWLTGTKGMTRIEKDIYLTLLIFQFDSKNKLTSDLQELKRICEIKNKKEISALNYILKKKFTEQGEYMVNRKMNQVVEDQELYRQKQAKNGANGGRPKKAVGYSGLNETEPKKSPTTDTDTTTEKDRERNPLYFPIGSLEKILLSENSWHGTIGKEAGIKIPVVEVWVKKFILKLTNEGEEGKTIRDAKSHFRNWLLIELKKPENKSQNTINQNKPAAQNPKELNL